MISIYTPPKNMTDSKSWYFLVMSISRVFFDISLWNVIYGGYMTYHVIYRVIYHIYIYCDTLYVKNSVLHHIPCILWYITSYYLPYISCFLELFQPIYVHRRRFTSVLARDWALTCATRMAEHLLGTYLAICARWIRSDTLNTCMNYYTTTPSPRGYTPCRLVV